MSQQDLQRFIVGITLFKVMAIFANDGPTRDYFPIDRIQIDTGAEDSCGFLFACSGEQKISLFFGKDGLEVAADVSGNGALKTLRRIKNEYLPAHYPMIKIIERTIVTKD